MLLNLRLKLHNSLLHLGNRTIRSCKPPTLCGVLPFRFITRLSVLIVNVGKGVAFLRNEGRNEVNFTGRPVLVVDGEPLVDTHVDHEGRGLDVGPADRIRLN